MIVRNTTRVTYSAAHLLEQFFDFEHIQYVHPRSIGRVELRELGVGWVVFDVHWPGPLGFTYRTRLRQEFVAPDRITAEAIGGWGRAIGYEARLIPEGELTRVEEEVRIPGLTGFLARPFAGWIVGRMRLIWEEDLAVKMCKGGWPGLRGVGITSPR